MKKTALILVVITIISKFIGFFREITLSYFYGASNISDAYIISLTIPSVIFAFIGVGLATTFIPLYNTVKLEEGSEAANNFTSNVSNIVIVISTMILFLIYIFTDEIVKLFAFGFDENTLNLTVEFTRITSASIYFIGLGYIYRSLLQVKKNFIVPAIVGFPYNFVVIVSIVISAKWNVIFLPLGLLVATSLETIILGPSLKKVGYKYKFKLKIDKYLKRMFFLSIPVILGTSVNQINKLVDRTLASQIAVGGISALNYATRLNYFVQGVFVVSVVTVMYPLISKLAAENNIRALKKVLSESIIGVTLLVLPATVGSMIFSEEIIVLLFGRGAFDYTAIKMTSISLFYYSIGMLAFGIREILARVFYSIKDTKTPMINAGIGMILNIILNIILSKYLGIGGLALATSLSAVVINVLMFVSLRRKIGQYGFKAMSIKFAKILVASLFMGLIAKLIHISLNMRVHPNFSLIISIMSGGVLYFSIIYFMKIDDVEILVKQIKNKLNNKRNL